MGLDVAEAMSYLHNEGGVRGPRSRSCLSLTFHSYSHCLSVTVRCLSAAFLWPSTVFHCLQVRGQGQVPILHRDLKSPNLLLREFPAGAEANPNFVPMVKVTE